MRSCSMLRILPVALICSLGLPVISSADIRNTDQDSNLSCGKYACNVASGDFNWGCQPCTTEFDIPLLREEEQENSSDFGLHSTSFLLDVIERILDRLESSALPPQDNDINSAPETSWPPLENDFLSRDHVYLPKSSSKGLTLGVTSHGKWQRAPCTDVMCRVIRGRARGNANAGARALPFGKRSDARNSDEAGMRSVRGRRRGRGRPRSRGSPHGHPQQSTLPFGKRRL